MAKPMSRARAVIGKVAAVVIVLGVLALAAAYFSRSTAQGEAGQLVLGQVRVGDVERVVSCSGTLSAVETVDVGAQVSGTIKKLHVDFNEEVKEGQVLLELDTSLFAADVKQARAGVARAKAELDKAKLDLARIRKLHEKGYATEEDFIVAQTQVETAKASLASAKASSSMSTTKLGYTVIRSPIDGTIITRNVEEGQTIASSFSTPSLFIIAADLSAMQIEANVDESDIGLIQVGQIARFTVQAYTDRTYDGTVRQIRLTPQTIQNVVNYSVVVDVQNDDRSLLPGMTATLDFIVDQRKGVLVVPSAALSFELTAEMLAPPQERGVLFWLEMKALFGKAPGGKRPAMDPVPEGRDRVWILAKDGRPMPVDIVTGLADEASTEVVSPGALHERDRVITGYKKEAAKKASGPKLFGGPPGGGPPP